MTIAEIRPVRSPFPNPYRYVTLGPGANAVIWEEEVPGDSWGMIKEVATRYYATQGIGVYYRFVVDGEEVEYVQQRLGNFYSPTELKPPMVANSFIRWTGFNPTVATYILEVRCVGYFLMKPPLPSAG